MANLQHNANVNDTRFADLTKVVTRLGKDAAEGQDALPKLAFAAVNAAYDGVIDTEDKHEVTRDGKAVKIDDAAAIYNVYMNAEGKKTFQDYKSAGIKANVSKLRQLVELGMNPHCEGPKVLARASELRDEMAKAGTKVQSAYPAFVSVARKQKELDVAISDDQIRECVAKPTSDAKNVADYVKRASNILDKLITGENSDGAQCQDENVIAAFESLSKFLTLSTERAEREALLARAIELGLAPRLITHQAA